MLFWIALIIANLAVGLWLLLAGWRDLSPEFANSELNSAEIIATATVTTSANQTQPPPQQLVVAASPVEDAMQDDRTELSAIEFELPRVPIGEGAQSWKVFVDESPEALSASTQASPIELDEGAVASPPKRYRGNDFRASKLGAHIFSDQPERRMVMLDGKAFREQDTLPNGWALLEIGREQLVVEQQGQRYSLPLSDLR
jgi:hypothetical protein